MCGATKGGLSVAGHRRHQGSGHPGPRAAGRRARSPARTSGCSTRPASSPPRCPTSATGHFRFFAGDGSWTLRTLAPGAKVDRAVVAARGSVAEIDVELDAA